MATYHQGRGAGDYDDVSLEVILQRIFNEKDPTAHRAAIWELFSRSGDWDLFERVSQFGGERGISAYFQNILNHLDNPETDEEDAGYLPAIPVENREQVRELYEAPLICLRHGDWAGSAAAMHEILLTEIYDVYQISEEELAFGDATALSLGEWVSEEVLFPLSVIEHLAYSDYLTGDLDPELLDNHLAIALTLFFSAQAHLDVEEARKRPGFRPGGHN
jgi:hypothetical protein